jgi:hypothetical protein
MKSTQVTNEEQYQLTVEFAKKVLEVLSYYSLSDPINEISDNVFETIGESPSILRIDEDSQNISIIINNIYITFDIISDNFEFSFCDSDFSSFSLFFDNKKSFFNYNQNKDVVSIDSEQIYVNVNNLVHYWLNFHKLFLFWYDLVLKNKSK